MARQISEAEVNALYERCLTLHKAGSFAGAEKLYLKIFKVIPNNPEIVRNFATLQFQRGRHAKALQIMERARALEPDSPVLEYNIGKILSEMGRHDEAETHLRACLALSPNFSDAMANLGATLVLLGRYGEAIDWLERAIELNPTATAPLVTLGVVLTFLQKHAAAEDVFKQVLAIDPSDQEALLALAQLKYRNEKFSEAIEIFQCLLDACPGHQQALSGLIIAKLLLCDWSDLEAQKTAFLKGLSRADGKSHETTQSPFTASLICDDPADCLQAARVANLSREQGKSYSVEPCRRTKTDKIKVAYLSADYRQHATSYLVCELMECHDRSAFEITSISFGPDDKTPMRRRMEQAFDRFEDLTEFSAANIAKRLADLEIDIAVDLHGFTHRARMDIFRYHATPIQVLYLGWPGTVGAKFFDYVLADPFVAPKENFQFFTESVVWLPHCYQPNDRRRKVASEAPNRKDCGLPETGFIFCCFNNTFKILPEIFDIWMRLISKAPGSVLWLLETSKISRENLQREAGARGVDPSRLIFAPKAPNDQHLARLAHADLVLDTIPYNAHTTASDALWQGVPVVTCTGRTFASRVATSLLHNVGLPELAVTNLEDYEALAFRLAVEPSSVKAMKQQLLAQRLTAPLFDTPQLARDIEAAYREMVRRFDQNIKPGFIDVRTLGN